MLHAGFSVATNFSLFTLIHARACLRIPFHTRPLASRSNTRSATTFLVMFTTAHAITNDIIEIFAHTAACFDTNITATSLSGRTDIFASIRFRRTAFTCRTGCLITTRFTNRATVSDQVAIPLIFTNFLCLNIRTAFIVNANFLFIAQAFTSIRKDIATFTGRTILFLTTCFTGITSAFQNTAQVLFPARLFRRTRRTTSIQFVHAFRLCTVFTIGTNITSVHIETARILIRTFFKCRAPGTAFALFIYAQRTFT